MKLFDKCGLAASFGLAVGVLAAGLMFAVPSKAQNAVGQQTVFANTPFAVSGGAFNRPANTTAYASGQLVANDTVAANVVPVQIGGGVCRAGGDVGATRGIRLEKSGTSIANASFRVHLFRQAPTMTNGDGGVYLPANGRASRLKSNGTRRDTRPGLKRSHTRP